MQLVAMHDLFGTSDARSVSRYTASFIALSAVCLAAMRADRKKSRRPPSRAGRSSSNAGSAATSARNANAAPASSSSSAVAPQRLLRSHSNTQKTEQTDAPLRSSSGSGSSASDSESDSSSADDAGGSKQSSSSAAGSQAKRRARSDSADAHKSTFYSRLARYAREDDEQVQRICIFCKGFACELALTQIISCVAALRKMSRKER